MSAGSAPGVGGGFTQVVAVRHDSSDRAFALKVARLAGRLLRLHKDKVGQEASYQQDEEVAQVWLTRVKAPHKAKAAAETQVNNVYLFEVAEPRKEIEWARTIAHEWGHLVLLAARGYKDPENDAAGFLGERLFLKWLREDALALPRKTDDFCEREGLQLYYDRQLAPLMARYNAAGPADKRLSQLNTEGMDYYIGMALDTDDVFGLGIARCRFVGLSNCLRRCRALCFGILFVVQNAAHDDATVAQSDVCRRNSHAFDHHRINVHLVGFD